GANGAAGPFGPAEQAWLAEAITRKQRGSIYSLNNAIGFFGMGLGAVFAGLVPLWQGALPGATAYRPLFAWVLAANAFNFFLLRRTPGGARPERVVRAAPAPSPAATTTTPATPAAATGIVLDRRTENRALVKLTISNAVNGFAIGLFGPLTSYWFAAKFGVGPEAIGPVFALTFVVTGFASLWAGRMSRRVGIVRSVILIRYVGVALLVALPLVPWYWAAAALYVLRSALNRGTAGPRQALTMGLVRDERRGTAASIGGASFQLPGAAGPTLGGLMLEHGALAMPWLIGAGLQLAYAWMYGFFFREYEIKDEPRGSAARAAR
ncbi:MAG TPA: MFS transporter, partial [Limnochordia bacterium]|nr:MFS transporter [Limnochordia bacterium]